MQDKGNISASELMSILTNTLRELSSMDLNDKNVGKCIARSKEISNLAGKAISLSVYELEKNKAGFTNPTNLLPTENGNNVTG